jgi:hypothetical protein
VKAVRVEVLLRQLVQVTAKVEVDLVCYWGVHLAIEGSLISSKDSYVLSLGMIHDTRNWVSFGFHSHYKLSALVAVNRQNFEEIIKIRRLIICFGGDYVVVAMEGQRLLTHLPEGSQRELTEKLRVSFWVDNPFVGP